MALEVSKICDALGNETRFRLVKALHNGSYKTCCDLIEIAEKGICVADVVKLTGFAQSTVSRHLSVLEEAGVLRKEKREHWSCYFLDEKLLGDYLAQMNQDLLGGKNRDS